jgi:aspartate racemase
MSKMIGIVGGVGSYAGIDLIKKIYDYSGAITDQDHLPISMISIPHKVLDRTKYLLHEIDQNPGEGIAEIMERLFHNGAEVIGIPCNTAHAPVIFEIIENAVPKGCKVVHMINEVGTYLKSNYNGLKRVGVLSTNGTYYSNIYPGILSTFGFQVIQPSLEIQHHFVHPSIYNPEYGIKAFSNPVTKQAKENLLTAIAHLITKGVEAVILGCTEIPLAINGSHFRNCVLIDSTTVLAKALIREAREE